MKVKTINPVIVNGKRESEPSEYLSANGMGEYETTLNSVSSQEFNNYYGANGMGEFETTLNSVSSQEFNNYYGANGMGEYETTQQGYVNQALNDDYFNADGDNDDYYGFDANGKPTKSSEVKLFQKWLVAKGVDISFTTKATATKPSKTYSGAAAIDGDMRSGSKTAKAWDTYGAEWVKSMKDLGLAIGADFGGISSTPDAGSPPIAEQIEQAKKGKIWDRAKGWIESGKAQELLAKVQESGGIRGFLSGLFGNKGGSDSGFGFGTTTTEETKKDNKDDDIKPGMSMPMKIGIAVGAVLVLGIIIYAVTRPKAGAVAPAPIGK